MGDETKKRERTTAKRLFTRNANSLKKAIDYRDDIDVLNNRFKSLKKCWKDVSQKHEEYIQSIGDEDDNLIEQEDLWIIELQERYEMLEVQHSETVRDILEVEDNRRAEKEESMLFKEFKDQFNKCKLMHNEYMETVDATEDDLKWIMPMQGKYVTIVQKYGKCDLISKRLDVHNSSERGMNKIRLERMKYPRFEGDTRDYPRFKHDFNKFVSPEINCTESIAYVLRSCLTGEALNVVSNVDDDINAICTRLDEKFGKPTKLVDLIMQDIKALKQITDGQDVKFIELVNIVERGYKDLKRINFEREMANSIVVSMIEAVLPRHVKREWSREVNQKNSTVDERNKFEDLRIIEYQNDALRAYAPKDNYSSNNSNFNSNFNRSNNFNQTNQDSCLIHKSAQHNTRECNKYLRQSNEEKVNLLKENNACFCCLVSGHRSSQCNEKQISTIPHCGKYHHHSLDEAHTAGMMFHSVINSESDFFPESSLLSVMEVSTGNPHIKANVLWDGGATNSLITFNKAKELKLKGRPVVLNVTKVGGHPKM